MFVEKIAQVYDDKLPETFCNDILKTGLNRPQQLATIGGSEGKPVKETRDSNICWLDEPWIYRTILPIIHRANEEAGWNFVLETIEKCQFTKYKHTSKQHYNWHIDNYHGKKIRKLSFTLQLSNENEYEGGEFLMNTGVTKETIHDFRQFKKKGTIIIFPSFMKHRVKPVTKGTRYSLVSWISGPVFI